MNVHFSDKRLLIIFEPHALSWRRKDYVHNYQNLFNGAKKVYVYTNAIPEPKDNTTMTGKEIITHIKNGGARAVQLHKNLSPLLEETQEGDIILCLSSGAVDGILPTLTDILEKRFSA